MYEEPRFENPWKDTEGFVHLGRCDYGVIRHQGYVYVFHRFDLYAIPTAAGTIKLGARYGNERHEYVPGAAYQQEDGTWQFHGGREIFLAGALYFANHYQKE